MSRQINTSDISPLLTTLGIASPIYAPISFPAQGYNSNVYTSAGGSDLSGTSVQPHLMVGDPSAGISPVYGNFSNSGGGESTTNLATITVKASAYFNGVFYPFTWNGVSSGVINPGDAAVRPDFLVIPGLIRGSWVRIYTFAQWQSGKAIPLGPYSTTASATLTTGVPIGFSDSSGVYNFGDNYPSHSGGNGSDQTANSNYTWCSQYNGLSYGPMYIVTKRTGNVVMAAIGDSILQYNGDNAGPGFGYFSRGMLASGRCMKRLAQANENAYAFANPALSAARRTLLVGCTSAYEAYGRNDIDNGQTLAQVQASRIAIWTVCQNLNIRTYAGTVTPETTSTDSWATTANQTISNSGYETVRTGLNTWLRAGAPILSGVAVTAGTTNALIAGNPGHPLTAILDVASKVEVDVSNAFVLNGGRWYCGPSNNTAYTQDGKHPRDLAHALMTSLIALCPF